MTTRAQLRHGAMTLATATIVVAMGCGSPQPPADTKRHRSAASEPGARGARPRAPSPPLPSAKASELGPPDVPATRAGATRALHAWLGRLERRRAAIQHPFGPDATPVLDHVRREAMHAVEAVETSDPWQPRYVRAWRSLSDYERSLRQVAREEGIRPRRLSIQPDQLPIADHRRVD